MYYITNLFISECLWAPTFLSPTFVENLKEKSSLLLHWEKFFGFIAVTWWVFSVCQASVNTAALQVLTVRVWVNNVGADPGDVCHRSNSVSSVRVFCPLQVMYLFLHTVKGTPFETPDQGKARLLTHWEQMDYGVQFTSSRKFLTISPIVL